jgi:hypothetical protein
MLKREDFVLGMVQQSLYQRAAAMDAPTNAEMEIFEMAVILKVLSNTLLVTLYQDNIIALQYFC